MNRLLAMLFTILLAGCGTLHNTVRDADEDRLALRGNDVVAYFTVGGPVKGDPAIRSQYDGDVYRFASDANKRLFEASPQKYAPAWTGFCASGVHYALKEIGRAHV